MRTFFPYIANIFMRPELFLLLIGCFRLCEADITMSSQEGVHLKRGTVGEREKGMGRKGGGSVYSQPGIRADRDRTTTQRRDSK
jgi:hypothetical protein